MRMAAIRPAATVVMAVFLFGLVFAIYTQHVWEDYWITFRCSRNLATGHGLVFTPGERVHSFTSPLGVLLPAGFSWLTGNESDELALWLFRLTSLAALAAGMGLLFLLLQRLQQHRLAIWLTVALLGLDAKLVDFSINGMETGLLFFFLALTIHGLVVPGSRQILRIGVGWAGLMWTRPDSFVYIAALGISALLFSPNRTAGQSRKELWKTLLAACLVCTVLYLPWFLWAWSYYGSPVPHTIVAKGTNLPPFSLSAQLFDLLVFPGTLLIDVTSLLWVFTPTYAWFGGWPGSHFPALHGAGDCGRPGLAIPAVASPNPAVLDGLFSRKLFSDCGPERILPVVFADSGGVRLFDHRSHLRPGALFGIKTAAMWLGRGMALSSTEGIAHIRRRTCHWSGGGDHLCRASNAGATATH